MKTLLIVVCSLLSFRSDAQILELIKAVTTKVIKAIDLKVQEEQNRVMVLQVVQKQLENELSEKKLKEISNWLEEQRKLYAEYYGSLQKVTPMIRDAKKVAGVITKQKQVLTQYNNCIRLLKQSANLSPPDAQQLVNECDEILEQSLVNLDQLIMIAKSTNLRMNAAERMQAVNRCDKLVNGQLAEMKTIYRQISSSIEQNAISNKENQQLKDLYGL